jgi:hypothetical protein
MLDCMGYWFVMGPGGPYIEDVEPTELDSGQLQLDNGHKLPAGTWTKRSHEGDKPEMPRAAKGTPSDKPD